MSFTKSRSLTTSVVDTPSVLLHSLYLPAFFTSSYVSVPSDVRVMSSENVIF